MTPDYVAIGQIGRPWGVKGHVHIQPLTDFPDRFQPGLEVYLSPPKTAGKPLRLTEVTRTPKNIYVKFEDFDSRDEVESLKDRYLMVPPEESVPLPPGGYWVYQIIGLDVYTTEHEYLGRIEEVLRTRANDVYVIKDREQEKLIPALKEVVREVRVEEGKMIIEPPPGLFD